MSLIGIYQNVDGSVAVVVPAMEVLDVVGMFSIMEKDTPQDLPYWVIDSSELPPRTDRNRWVLEDMPEPDGFGKESNEFTDAELQALYAQGVIK